MKCKICEAESFYFARAKVLNKYDVSYFQCRNCRFVQTEDPYWLEEAYASPIAHSDAGLVFRNYMLSRVASNIIAKLFNPEANFLDCGGGYGLFVRLMRDINYKFFWQDKYCENIFSQGFEANLQEGETYEVATSFEVFEHFVNPIVEISEILKYSKNILFSTELLPDSDPKPEEWWYYAPHEGQHISFYTPKSLFILAERLGLNLYSNGSSLHLLTESNIPEALFERLSYYDSLGLKDFLLVSRDYQQTIEKVDSEQYKVKVRETEAELGRTQAQLHDTYAQWVQSQAQLHATQTELGQAQGQLHEKEAQLVQSQVQLHAAKTEIGRSQAKLHEKESELVQFQAQLYQTQEEVERSQARLHQNEAKVAQLQAQQHQMQEDFERSQEQLQQRQEELEVLQAQLQAAELEAANFQKQQHQMQADFERTQAELQQRQEELEVLQAQRQAAELEAANFQRQQHQMQEDFERTQEQLQQRQEELEVLQGLLHAAEVEVVNLRSQEYRTQEELSQAMSVAHCAQQEMKQWQSQYHEVFAELEQSQSQLHQLQEQLERSQAQGERDHWELQRAEFQQAVANQANGNGQKHYRLLVWEGWYAYRSGDLKKMRECLQESLKFTSLPRTETVSNWLESFSTFSSEKGGQLDSHALTNSEEWKQLMRRLLTKANSSKI
ncbi:methyltransferase domain-containing protein [Microcoleus sp. T2B6]|uniref:methyltransferase domain-containing protein n=1 Tax=Microcoleus sp. T2B6 TaxID=3055424 RepID=UPI002FCEF3C5